MKKLQDSRDTKASFPGPLPSVQVRRQAAAYKERNIRAGTLQFAVCDYEVLLMQTFHWQNWETISVIKEIHKFVQLQTQILNTPKNCGIFALPEKMIVSWLNTLLSNFLFQAETSTIPSQIRILLNHKSGKKKTLDAIYIFAVVLLSK